MSERIYIKRQKNRINRQTDIEFLEEACMPFLNNLLLNNRRQFINIKHNFQF